MLGGDYPSWGQRSDHRTSQSFQVQGLEGLLSLVVSCICHLSLVGLAKRPNLRLSQGLTGMS